MCDWKKFAWEHVLMFKNQIILYYENLAILKKKKQAWKQSCCLLTYLIVVTSIDSIKKMSNKQIKQLAKEDDKYHKENALIIEQLRNMPAYNSLYKLYGKTKLVLFDLMGLIHETQVLLFYILFVYDKEL